MPSWENTPASDRICTQCGGTFLAKRESAKYCSPTCRERARGPRPYDPEKRREQHIRRLGRPGWREASNARANERVKAVKTWLSTYKMQHGCTDCGYNAHPVALDFDHMNGKTKNLANMKSIQAAQAEIERHGCVVRCANCHRIKSWETRTWEGCHASPTGS